MKLKDTSAPEADPHENDRNDELGESPVPDPEHDDDDRPSGKDDPGADQSPLRIVT